MTVPVLLAGAVVLFACGVSERENGADLPPDRRPPGAEASPDTTAQAMDDTMTIEQALAEHSDAWMRVDGVEGTGIGLCDDLPCIKIFVSRPPEEFGEHLPDSVAGYPIRLEPTGRFEVQ